MHIPASLLFHRFEDHQLTQRFSFACSAKPQRLLLACFSVTLSQLQLARKPSPPPLPEFHHELSVQGLACRE